MTPQALGVGRTVGRLAGGPLLCVGVALCRLACPRLTSLRFGSAPLRAGIGFVFALTGALVVRTRALPLILGAPGRLLRALVLRLRLTFEPFGVQRTARPRGMFTLHRTCALLDRPQLLLGGAPVLRDLRLAGR
ncbi:MAG TPA: hypothetical protein PKJ79_10255, partial [Quisquiliibacterium sp.]|nr:hypothetical protein [Quisquiliibacterium sp.]